MDEYFKINIYDKNKIEILSNILETEKKYLIYTFEEFIENIENICTEFNIVCIFCRHNENPEDVVRGYEKIYKNNFVIIKIIKENRIQKMSKNYNKLPKKIYDAKTKTIIELNRNIEYICVSYVWGKNVKCDLVEWPVGMNTIKVVNYINWIYINIKSIKLNNQEIKLRYFWIDALCIDQTNKIEKSEEIKKMGSIYFNSKICFVFDDYMMSIYEYINNLKYNTNTNIETYQINNFIDLNENMSYMWYKRCWTFQECLLSNELYFIHLTLNNDFLYINSETYFYMLLDIINDTRFKKFANNIFKNITDELYEKLKARVTFRSNNENNQNYSAIDLLIYTSKKECSMPEDKYYSLYSLIGNSDVDIIYDIDEKDMIKKFVEHCIQNNDASVLSYAGNRCSIESWKPDDTDKFIKFHNNNLKITNITKYNDNLNIQINCNVLKLEKNDIEICNINLDNAIEDIIYFLINNCNILSLKSKEEFIRLYKKEDNFNNIFNEMNKINYKINDLYNFIELIKKHNFIYLWNTKYDELIATNNILNENCVLMLTSENDCQTILELNLIENNLVKVKQTCIYFSPNGLDLLKLNNKTIMLN